MPNPHLSRVWMALLLLLSQQQGIAFQQLFATRTRLTRHCTTSISRQQRYERSLPLHNDRRCSFLPGARYAECSRPRTRLFSTVSTPSSSSASAYSQHRDVVIVGGGLAGLSVALYLSELDPTRHVTILDCGSAVAASPAAAGMLAPQSERLPQGPLLDLCLASRNMFGSFGRWVEDLARTSGSLGHAHLPDASEHGLEPWQIGYIGTGGFLAPAFAGDTVATWAPPNDAGGAVWLDATQVRELEPSLHPEVVGGWWFPEDASVDARRLTNSLKAACVARGVQLMQGPDYELTSLDLTGGTCQGLHLHNGWSIHANMVVLATGAWMRQLLPVPIASHKGQSLSLRAPPSSSQQSPLLRRVLFAQDSYIVPKADGRIIVGATVEAGATDSHITPAGLLHILTHALQLVPDLAHYCVEDTWVGLRPTTPDKGPILGETPWDNVLLAGGYWRNGVLLAPKTGQLLAQLIVDKSSTTSKSLSDADRALLDAFAWNRFTSPEGGATMAANARYASQVHPVQTRTSGAGVAASVGTELGSYSTARQAKEERARDRQLFSENSGGSALERAAALGKSDAAAYTMGDTDSATTKDNTQQADTTEDGSNNADDRCTDVIVENNEEKEDDVDAVSKDSSNDMNDVYASIRANKAQTPMVMEEDDEDDERPDPGFRIYHVDEDTGEKTVVPPYTTPGDFMAMLEQRKQQQQKPQESQAEPLPSNDTTAATTTTTKDDKHNKGGEDLEDVYASIRANKEAAHPTWPDLLEEEDEEEELPDPGFRIYHVDPETGEPREIPPYTRPEVFLASLEQEKQQKLEQQRGAAEAPSTKPKEDSSNVPADSNAKDGAASDEPTDNKTTSTKEYNEKTFDGYTVIQQANARSSRDDELDAMRAARQKNRREHTDVSQIGVLNWDDHHETINNASR